jgi:hypothetical protein
MDAFVIRSVPFAAQQSVESPVAKPWALGGQLT